jgi:hypothetical protein
MTWAAGAVPFHGDEIVTFESGGVHYVAMRHIAENLGLDWSRQYRKLLEQKDKFSCCPMATHDSGGSGWRAA